MSTSAQRVLNVLKALKGRSLQGLSNKELAVALADSPVNITRATADLVESGFITKLDSGNYALSVQFLQIATAHALEMQKAQDRINELNQRVHAGAHQLNTRNELLEAGLSLVEDMMK